MDRNNEDGEINSRSLILDKVPIKPQLKPEKTMKRYHLRKPAVKIKLENTSQVETVTCGPNINMFVNQTETDSESHDSVNLFNISSVEGPPYACQNCDEWFLVRDKLLAHYVTKHKLYHCSFCILLFWTVDDRIRHENRIHCPIKCELCPNSYGDTSQINEHYETDHNVVTCCFCNVIIQPKSCYIEHIKKRHIVNEKYFESEDRITIIEGKVSKWNFQCRLCNKRRQKKDFFGHFHMYHKITIVCFLQLIGNGNVDIDIQGNTLIQNDPLDISEEGPVVSKPIYTNLDCMVCNTKSINLPYIFHQMYCQKKAACKFCLEVFSDHYKLHYHKEQTHKYHECTLGCKNIVCPIESQLHVHYSKFHDIVACKFCDIFVSADPEKLDNHLKEAHAIKETVVEDILDVNYLYTTSDKKVLCSLCERNITDMIPNVTNMFLHYTKDHALVLKALASFNPTNPFNSPEREFVDANVENLKLANARINEKSTADDLDDPESQTVAINDVKLNTKHGKNTEIYIAEPIEDFDPHEVECFLNDSSDDDASDDLSNQNALKIKDEPVEDEDQDTQRLRYNCDMCEEKLITKSELLGHAQLVHGFVTKLMLLTCDRCLETFTNESSYELHLIDEHGTDLQNGRLIHTCPFCGRKDFRSQLRKHLLETHLEEATVNNLVKTFGLKCRFCDDFLWSSIARNDHEVLKHKDEEKNFFKCATCYTIFSSKVCLKKHVHASHKIEPRFEPTRLFYKCLQCQVLLSRLENIRDHFLSQHPDSRIFRCTNEGCFVRLKTKKTYVVHMKNIHHPDRVDEASPRGCKLCGKWLSSPRAAKTHYRMKHSEENRVGLGCRLCSQRFETAEVRKFHYSTVHSGIRAYICSKCGKGFNSKSGLYGHRQLHMNHSFECEFCHKVFVRRDTYNEHLLIHSGPKHQCPYCPRSFTQRSNLTRHTRIHTGDKPYQCTMCPKRFSDKGACNSHIRVHTREEVCSCSYCGKSFSKKQKLTYHIRKHTGQGLVTCQTCSKVFTSSFSLKEHQMTHKVGTQLLCTQCNRGFSHERYLRRHIVSMHTPIGRKYHCQLCEKKFVSQNQRNAHLLSHSGLKHTKCLLCEVAYASRKSIVRHLMEAHNISVKGDTDTLNKYTHRMTLEEAGMIFPEENSSDEQLPTMIQNTDANSQRNNARNTKHSSSSGEDNTQTVVTTKSRKIKKPKRYLEDAPRSKINSQPETFLDIDIKDEQEDESENS